MPLKNVMNAATAFTSDRSAPLAASSSEIIVIGSAPTNSARSLTTGIGAISTSMMGWSGPVMFLTSLAIGPRNPVRNVPRSR